MSLGRLGAITLAVVATALTLSSGVRAEPVGSIPDAAVEGATPLALRPSKPLELAPERPQSGLGWKLVAVATALGGAAFFVRRRLPARRAETAPLTIVRRASIGMRSELLIVSVEGQRLLLGVTPHSIQSLALLDTDDAASSATVPAKTGPSFGDRFGELLDGIERQAAGDEASTKPEREELLVAGQARGLSALRRRR